MAIGIANGFGLGIEDTAVLPAVQVHEIITFAETIAVVSEHIGLFGSVIQAKRRIVARKFAVGIAGSKCTIRTQTLFPLQANINDTGITGRLVLSRRLGNYFNSLNIGSL